MLPIVDVTGGKGNSVPPQNSNPRLETTASTDPSSAVKQRGREKWAPRNHPEISSQKLADFECRFPYDSYGKNRAPFWPFWDKDFGATSGGPFFSRPLCFAAEKEGRRQHKTVTTIWCTLNLLISGSRPFWPYFSWQLLEKERIAHMHLPLLIARKIWPGRSGPTS